MTVHERPVGATVEWYTPPSLFDALGLTFDLDPASPWRCGVPTPGPAALHPKRRPSGPVVSRIDPVSTESDPTRPERPARKCWKHQWAIRCRLDGRWNGCPDHFHLGPDQEETACTRCGRVRDEAAAKRNKRNAQRGKRIQRQRIVGLGGQNLPGNKPNHDGIGVRFSYESKSGPSAFSERYWRWLRGIPRTADQAGVLIVTDTPGPGHRARAYVVVDYDDWRDEHGEETAA